MKKLINDLRNVVREVLEGLAYLTPGLALLDTENVALLAGLPATKRPMAVISGGGPGHEPAHAGYVWSGFPLHCKPRIPSDKNRMVAVATQQKKWFEPRRRLAAEGARPAMQPVPKTVL